MRERVCVQRRGQFVTQVTTVAPKGLTIKETKSVRGPVGRSRVHARPDPGARSTLCENAIIFIRAGLLDERDVRSLGTKAGARVVAV